MPEPEREPRVMHRSGEPPKPGMRKEPSGQVKSIPPKKEGREPGHGEASAAIGRALHDVEFPKSRQELVDEVGHRRINLGGDKAVDLGQILKRIPVAKFASAEEVRTSVNRNWDDLVGMGGWFPGERE